MTKEKEQGKKKVTEVKTFSLPFASGEIKENITVNTNTPSKPSKEQIINQAFKFHSQGNTSEAAKYYQQLINQGCNDHSVYSRYGEILKDNGKLNEAEKYLRKAIKLNSYNSNDRKNLGSILIQYGQLDEAKIETEKAIELNPNFDKAHLNLGVIFRSKGQLKEAEISTRKAIEINPDLAMAHSNMGVISKDLGKLQEAENSYRKAIEINPDCADIHYNLGGILIDLGKSQEAELSLRKAIELKPDFAGAYLNLGDVLRALGKLQEAELSLRKAIELKPSFTNAYLNLAYLFQERGNYKNSNKTFTNILSLETTNINDKLKVLTQLHLNSLIEGKFSKFDQISNYAKQLNNKQSSFDKYDFVFKLGLELKDQKEQSNYSNLTHIGDSHCMSFSHQFTILKSKKRKLIPLYIRGAKAWHFANKKMNLWKASFTEQIKNHNYSKELLISFGELDCRKGEGILPFSIKYNKEIFEVCKKTINGYLNYMENHLGSLYSNRYYFGIPAPVGAEGVKDELDKKRIELIRVYNALLKKEVLSRGSSFLDVYELTADKNGENNILYMCDDIHLSPKCLNILFENHLYKPERIIH